MGSGNTEGGRKPGAGAGGWRASLEPLIAIALGALPSVAALSSGGQEWPDRLPIFVATALMGLLAVAILPGSAWHLYRSDKILFFTALCGGLFLLALDLSGSVMVVGPQGEEIVFRRNGWDGTVFFLTFLCLGLCLWVAQILVRRHDAGREWLVASLLAFGLAYCGARAIVTFAGGHFPGADNTGFVNRNAFAHFALLHASLALGIILSGRRGRRGRPGEGGTGQPIAALAVRLPHVLALVAAAALALAAASTTSRGGLLSWAVVLASWFVVSRRSVSARGGLLSIVAFMALITAAAWFGPEVLTRFQTEHMSFATRVEVWKRCIALSLDSPFFGFGPRSFTDAFNSRYSLGGGKVFTHAEHSYLTFAIEYGWVLWAALVAWFIWNLVQAWTVRRDSWRTYCLVSIPLGLFLAHGLGETLWRFPAILLVVSIVLAFNRGRSSFPHRGLRRPTPGPWNLMAVGASLLLLAGAGYGYWVQSQHARAMRALDGGQAERAHAPTETLLKSSLDERLLLLRLGRRWIQHLDRSGLIAPELQLTARRVSDELVRRHPSNWESWMLWVWPRLEDAAQETDVAVGIRRALLCRPHWESLYVRVMDEVSRYAPSMLDKVYESLPTSQRVMLWNSLSRRLGGMNRPFLAWASQQPMAPEIQSEVLRAEARFEASPDTVARLLEAWRNPEIPWAERRTVGDQLLKSLGPEKWFDEFPADLEANFEAQLYRLNRGLQYQLRDRVKARLVAMRVPESVADPRQPVQFAELHVSSGLLDEGKVLCRQLLANSPTVRRASERSESVKQQYAQYEPRAVIDLLWSKARATGSQEVWMNLINFLLMHEEYPQAATAIRLFPGTQQQVDEKKEITLYRARVAEATQKPQEALAALVQLIYMEIPSGG
ncbi:MAG: O-antigen ligase family protein [Verrucomicrobiae bacterium]|nr:O-antigen ligase family protein [Verrucomicrobiae bacterium]